MPIGDSTSSFDEEIGKDVVDSSYKVHPRLGPGLLESAYEHCIAFEPRRRGHDVVHQLAVPLEYDGMRLEVGFRVDLLVDGRVVVEVKAVEKVLPVHEAQVLTQLKLLNLDLGYLINFNVPTIKEGIKRIVRFMK